MPVYRQDEKRFHFIHIPRTAGRFVESVIEDNNFKLENDLSDEIEGVERLHLHRDLYEKYLDIKGITNIAIIRNPIDRFFSCSIFLKRMYGNDIQFLWKILSCFP